MHKRLENAGVIGLVLALYGLGWICQDAFLLNWDISWCMHVAERLVMGGRYIRDFFDVNLPFTLLLYAPPVIFSKLSGIGFPLAFRIYVFSLSTLSLCLCYPWLSKAFPESQRSYAHVFLVTFTFLVLVLPQYQFGQREHLLVILTMPWFLLTASRLEGYRPPLWLAILTGLFSGTGFLIKPYFLAAFGLTELYYLYQSRRLSDVLRPETVSFYLLLCLCMAATFRFYPEYIFRVIPLLLTFFYSIYSQESMRTVLSQPVIFYCGFAGVFYLLQKNQLSCRLFFAVLFMAMAGFLVSYLIQHVSWNYHYLPALSIAILIFAILINALRIETRKAIRYANVFFPLLTLFVFLYPVWFLLQAWTTGTEFREERQPFIAFMQDHTAHKNVLFLTTSIEDALPAMDYSEAGLAARFVHFPLLPGIVKNDIPKANTPTSLMAREGKDLFIHMVTEDLQHRKPDLVFVDVRSFKPHFYEKKFDYIKYLSQDAQFRHAWSPYRYFATLDIPSLLKGKVTMDVYQYPKSSGVDVRHLKVGSFVLTGTGPHREVCIVAKNSYDLNKIILLKTTLSLTKKEQISLSQAPSGKLDLASRKNLALNDTMLAILSRLFPVYRMQVYQRTR